MVVKEPQEMSDAVKNYPEVRWNLPGFRPLQIGLITTLIATSLAGILSNPIFTLANNSVTHTPMLQTATAQKTEVRLVAKTYIQQEL
jgi:NAD(P)H-quinone oxidoreductase subunit 2